MDTIDHFKTNLLTLEEFDKLVSGGVASDELLMHARLGMAPLPTGPEWTCVDCGSQEGFTTVRYDNGLEPPDYDTQCNVCNSMEVAESPLEALHRSLEHVVELSAENLFLRKIWWVLHLATHRDPDGNTPTIAALYGDDGEMQCSLCGADFKRLQAEVLDERIRIFNAAYAKGA